MTGNTVRKTSFTDVDFFRRGKVRDVYDLKDKLLIISTDRVSCFDVVLPTCIPHKGEVLTALSLFWFDLTKDIVANHFLTADVDKYPQELAKHKDFKRAFHDSEEGEASSGGMRCEGIFRIRLERVPGEPVDMRRQATEGIWNSSAGSTRAVIFLLPKFNQVYKR